MVWSSLGLTCRHTSLAGCISPNILGVYCAIKVKLCFVTEEDIRNVIRGESGQEIAHVQSAGEVLGQEPLRSDHLVGMELFLFDQALPCAF